MHLTTLLLALALLWPPNVPMGSPSVPPVALTWPLGPPRPEVVRGWEPPAGPYAAGHRGLDLAAPVGAPVRAAASGVVTFAGRVAGRGVLTITLPGTGDPPLRTTYEPVEPLVTAGTTVTRGDPVATLAPRPAGGAGSPGAAGAAGAAHCPESCLHWGLLRGDTYLNPLLLLRQGPSRLLPVAGVSR
ncbi:M23 family metallopeptidase [Streptomyces sp. NPDC058579]|uniref:M23 family metallopeptidase n=1 Tax=Streptomyces sp. NPDC058579 TaxID=3346548 RepID=UPI0036675BE5